ncbi:hypothetical protein ACEPAH_9422 [Sanghuangporus vaninii]
MRSSLGRTLAVLSLVECAFAYEYNATGLETGTTVVKGIYALVFIALVGLSILIFAIARGHRVPYIPLLIALIFNIFAVLASIAYDILAADIDFNDGIPADAFVATTGINSLFYNWSVALVFLAFAHLIKVRVDNVVPPSGGQGLNFVWTIAYLAAFVIIFVFATTTSGLYIDYIRAASGEELITRREPNQKIDDYNNVYYTFSAVWYASAILLGALAFFAYNKARRAGAEDKVLKTLLFAAFPVHILHVIEDIIFTILWSPSGLKATFSNRDTIESAALAEAILYLGLHAATIAALLFVGLRRGNWMLPGESNDFQAWQKGQYGGYTGYPVQMGYPAQANYTTQAGYPTQTQYVDNSKVYQ